MTVGSRQSPSWFQRYLLPGLVFKGVVIGGGYATGRELVEFFLVSGPLGGLQGMLLAMVIWSIVCATSFMFARAFAVYDYQSFFKRLLGPFWIVFEVSYILLLILVVAVLAAAAGTTGSVVLGWPSWAGTALLMTGVIGVCTFGTEGVERMFKISSLLLYLVYALFVIFALASFGDLIPPQLARPIPTDGWLMGGVTYASYNVIAAMAALPFLRHLTSQRDALVAGLVSGPLAMLPGLLFFLSMMAFYPEIGDEALPSDFLLGQIGRTWLLIFFHTMIFIALLETGIGGVTAINERISAAWVKRTQSDMPRWVRFAVSAALVLGSGLVAVKVGLITLIASGYGAFGYLMLVIFILPLLTLGVWQLWQRQKKGTPA
jgi:uncharacterized membrane protein YkvI